MSDTGSPLLSLRRLGWSALAFYLFLAFIVPPFGGGPAVANTSAATAAAQDAPKKKDFWDKVDAVSGIISGIAVALIGFYATSVYSRRQKEAEERQKDQEILVSQIQTVEKFIPHLAGGDEQIKSAAIVAISALGNPDLAVKLSRAFSGPGATAALTDMASRPATPGAESAQRTLLSVLAPLQSRVAALHVDGKRQATAFVVGNQGWMATVAHSLALERGSGVSYSVKWPGEDAIAAHLLLADLEQDLALLQVSTERPFEPIVLEHRLPTRGEAITAIQIGLDGKILLRFGTVVDPQSDGFGPATISVDLQGFKGAGGSPVVHREGGLLGVMHGYDVKTGNRHLVPSEALQNFVREAQRKLARSS
jgi:hypothetical protein